MNVNYRYCIRLPEFNLGQLVLSPSLPPRRRLGGLHHMLVTARSSSANPAPSPSPPEKWTERKKKKEKNLDEVVT